MREPAGPGIQSLGAIQARLDQQIPQLYRDLALYVQVLREVLPACVDQACSHLAIQVQPRRYTRLHAAVRQHLHSRLKSHVARCCAFLTVEQLLNLASQMVRERHRLALRDHSRLLYSLQIGGQGGASDEGGPFPSSGAAESLPPGSIQLQLRPPLMAEVLPFPHPSSEAPLGATEDDGDDVPDGTPTPFSHSSADLFAALEDSAPLSDTPWSSGQLPRDPVQLLHCLEGWEVALSRRLRNLSHSVNVEMVRAGLLAGAVPIPLLDAVLAGQIEPQGAPANLLRLPLLPQEPGPLPHAPLGVLLRTVDLEMEQPRLRTCRRRLLLHRQETHKMAETSQRLQRRLQAHHAERLWRHDSQLNPPHQA